MSLTQEQKDFRDEIVKHIRVELIALHLGDDMTISEEEAASLLGIHPKTLSRMRLAGEIPAGYIGKSPRYGLGTIRAVMRHLADGNQLRAA